VRKQTELEKRKAAAMKLLTMLTSMFRRRHFYEVLPLDPVAFPVLLTAHREALRANLAEAAAAHRVDLSTMQPPAAQVGHAISDAACHQPPCSGRRAIVEDEVFIYVGLGRQSIHLLSFPRQQPAVARLSGPLLRLQRV
jgi:hypothetical protein